MLIWGCLHSCWKALLQVRGTSRVCKGERAPLPGPCAEGSREPPHRPTPVDRWPRQRPYLRPVQTGRGGARRGGTRAPWHQGRVTRDTQGRGLGAQTCGSQPGAPGLGTRPRDPALGARPLPLPTGGRGEHSEPPANVTATRPARLPAPPEWSFCRRHPIVVHRLRPRAGRPGGTSGVEPRTEPRAPAPPARAERSAPCAPDGHLPRLLPPPTAFRWPSLYHAHGHSRGRRAKRPESGEGDPSSSISRCARPRGARRPR